MIQNPTYGCLPAIIVDGWRVVKRVVKNISTVFAGTPLDWLERLDRKGEKAPIAV